MQDAFGERFDPVYSNVKFLMHFAIGTVDFVSFGVVCEHFFGPAMRQAPRSFRVARGPIGSFLLSFIRPMFLQKCYSITC